MNDFIETILIIIGVGFFPAVGIWLVLSDLKKQYQKGCEDGYNEEIGNSKKHGRPKGIASETKYNSGFIDGQIKAKQEKSIKSSDKTTEESNKNVGEYLLKHMEEFRSNNKK